MNKSKALKEVQRLKDVNISLENNIRETKQQISEETGKQNFDNFMQDLANDIFK